MKSKRILMGCLGAMLAIVGIAQAQDSLPKNQKPWSVRMAESEMVRNPESWQVDFQPSLKWDYCHGLELGAMMDVYDRYGDFKFYEYALAYADTMVNEDGTIKNISLRIIVWIVSIRVRCFSVFMNKPKMINTKKHWIC